MADDSKPRTVVRRWVDITVLLLIIALVISVVLPMLQQSSGPHGPLSFDKHSLKGIGAACILYMEDNDAYPPDLKTLLGPSDLTTLLGPDVAYLDEPEPAYLYDTDILISSRSYYPETQPATVPIDFEYIQLPVHGPDDLVMAWLDPSFHDGMGLVLTKDGTVHEATPEELASQLDATRKWLASQAVTQPATPQTPFE